MNGTSDVTTGPTRITATGDRKFVQVSAGMYHSLAVAADGTLWAWGDNSRGVLGVSLETEFATEPVQITSVGSRRFIQTSAGQSHSLALADDGTLWAWGYNGSGQIGLNGTADVRNGPRQITATGARKFTKVEAGPTRSFALADDGSLWAWGSNTWGVLGVNGTTNVTTGPMRVSSTGGRKFTDVSAGAQHTLAVAEDGTLWAWGRNSSGELGVNGTTNATNGPVLVTSTGDRRFLRVAAGDAFSQAVSEDGLLWGWGENNFGQAGLATRSDARSGPRQITSSGSTRFTRVEASYEYALAIDEDGSLWAWGDNFSGRRGVPPVPGTNGPVMRPQPDPVLESVLFGAREAEAESFVYLGGGAWRVLSPASQEVGPVDVAVQWSLAGEPQPLLNYPRAFVYSEPSEEPGPSDPDDPEPEDPEPENPEPSDPGDEEEPGEGPGSGSDPVPFDPSAEQQREPVLPVAVLDGPAELTVTAGGTAEIGASAVGWPQPETRWEVSLDGETWTPRVEDAEARTEVSGTGAEGNDSVPGQEPESDPAAQAGVDDLALFTVVSNIDAAAPPVGRTVGYRLVAWNEAGTVRTTPVMLTAVAEKGSTTSVQRGRWSLRTRVTVTDAKPGSLLVVVGRGSEAMRDAGLQSEDLRSRRGAAE